MSYGKIKNCQDCGNSFITKPRFVNFCSTYCKNPINRIGHVPWNKNLKLTDGQKARQNTEGLKKGWGWNKGKPNELARKRFLENNPNANGRLNNLRPKRPVNDPLKIYKSEVKKITYRTLKKMKLSGEWVPKTGKYKVDWQIDHIIPYKQGFELGLLPSILGSKKNIQFIKGEENRKKWDKFQSIEIINEITKGDL